MKNVRVAVNGTLMRGLELNANLLAVGATFLREAMTEPTYRLWSIDDRYPAMIRVATDGVAIAVEVWDVPSAGLSEILWQEPPGLCIGKVRLADGETVLGVLVMTNSSGKGANSGTIALPGSPKINIRPIGPTSPILSLPLPRFNFNGGQSDKFGACPSWV